MQQGGETSTKHASNGLHMGGSLCRSLGCLADFCAYQTFIALRRRDMTPRTNSCAKLTSSQHSAVSCGTAGDQQAGLGTREADRALPHPTPPTPPHTPSGLGNSW